MSPMILGAVRRRARPCAARRGARFALPAVLSACVCSGLAPARAQAPNPVPTPTPQAAASAPDASQQALLAPVTVRARRQGADATLARHVPAQDLNAARVASGDTASLLTGLAGGATRSAGGVSSLPVLDGMADDRLNVLVDGVTITSACANHMNPALSYIDPAAVGRVQVYPGIAPVHLGADAIGGTVQVEAPAPRFADPQEGTLRSGEVGSFYRSNGDAYGTHADATLATQSLSLNYRGSTQHAGNYAAAQGFKPAGPAYPGGPVLGASEVGSTAYDVNMQNLGIALRGQGQLLQLDVNTQRIPAQGFPNQRMDMTGNDADAASLRYTRDFTWGTLNAKAWARNVSHSMNFGPDKLFWYGVAAGMPMNTSGRERGAEVSGTWEVSARDTLRLGTSYVRLREDDWWPASQTSGMMGPNTFWNLNGGRRDRLDVWSEWQARWGAKWSTEFGLRSDRVQMDTGTVQGYGSPKYQPAADAFNAADRSRTDQNWNFTALARYVPDDEHSYALGYAHKVRSPNLYERYAWSTHQMAMEMIGWFGDGNGYVGNLALRPETAHTLSATADWHAADGSTWGISATPYYSYVQDYIGVQTCPTALCGPTPGSGFVLLQFANQSARIYGADVSAHMLLADTPRWGRVTARGVLSAVRGEAVDSGDNLYGMMPLNATLTLEQRRGAWTSQVQARVVSAKTRVSNTAREVPTGGYALLNLRTTYAWRRARLHLGVDNVFDKFYAQPLGGAYLGQGATMRFNGAGPAWGVPLPGPGRSLYAGVDLMF